LGDPVVAVVHPGGPVLSATLLVAIGAAVGMTAARD